MRQSTCSTVGRDREIAQMLDVVGRAENGTGAALVLVGDPGMGKTTLLGEVTTAAGERGVRALQCNGVQAESNLPFAGLNQLLRPVVDRLSTIPAEHAALLRAALGLDETRVAALYQVALASLELLASLATESPVLVVVDDLHWLDRSSADVLAFIGRRIGHEPIAMLAAVRPGTLDPLSSSQLPELFLPPLSTDASRELLDRVAPELTDESKEQILRTADGNPLALQQLPAADAPAGPLQQWMPVGEVLVRSFTARMAELPPATRALLLAAALDSASRLGELTRAAEQVIRRPISAADIQPAVNAGFIQVDGDRIVFCHRLVASAIYQSSPVADRLAMHAALAAAMDAHDDRRVWHAAAATLGTDDAVAGELEDVARRCIRRGGVSAAIAALERAAELVSDESRRFDLLLRAAEHAAAMGDQQRGNHRGTRA